jgi:murein L,D-transpeptidase YafK
MHLRCVLTTLFALLVATSTTQAQTTHRRDGYTLWSVRITQPIDSLVLHKAKRRLEAYANKQLVKYYIVSLGEEPIGAKRAEGDMRTPEGLYCINDRSRKSSYHANLGVSYPSYTDSLLARFYGQSPGGDIKLHGFPNRHLKMQENDYLNTDWTLGCIALHDLEIDELYTQVVMYCPILILP